MKNRRTTYLFSTILLAGILCFSCMDEVPVKNSDEKDPDNIKGEMGYVSFDISLDDVIASKANDGESEGIAVESYFNGLQLVIYNSSDVAIKDYYFDITLDNTGFKDNNNQTSFNTTSKVITLPAIPLEKKTHKVVAVLNPKNLDKAGKLQAFGYTGTDYYLTLKSDHNVNALMDNPINFYTSFRGTSAIDPNPANRYAVEMGVNLFATNFWISSGDASYPGLYSGLLEDSNKNANFLMTNADGVLRLNEEFIKPTEEEASLPANRRTIKVERAVAKVGLFKGTKIRDKGTFAGEKTYTVLNNGTITEPRWGSDIINMQTYLIRHTAPTAPADGGLQETTGTDRKYRYAIDSNFDNISIEKPVGMGTDVRAQHFFYIPDNSYLLRNWITTLPSGDNSTLDLENRYKYEYVTENTMNANEQYEDVTTRILLMCKYAPNGIEIGNSYYYYRGHAFTHSQILGFLSDLSTIPVKTYPELEGLVQVLADLKTREIFWPEKDGDINWPLRSVDPNNPPGEPKESVTYKELSYYKDGVSYYYILIRHFNDSESSTPMGYGRYGVVRNNVYRVIVEDVRGPGYTHIPNPKGADDKNPFIEADIQVTPWRVKNLYFNL